MTFTYDRMSYTTKYLSQVAISFFSFAWFDTSALPLGNYGDNFENYSVGDLVTELFPSYRSGSSIIINYK